MTGLGGSASVIDGVEVSWFSSGLSRYWGWLMLGKFYGLLNSSCFGLSSWFLESGRFTKITEWQSLVIWFLEETFTYTYRYYYCWNATELERVMKCLLHFAQLSVYATFEILRYSSFALFRSLNEASSTSALCWYLHATERPFLQMEASIHVVGQSHAESMSMIFRLHLS